ncbi:MAG TPA: GxxExxY protein [candidate division Zixibacteria bacterium]|jgi:GxxExxY protein
MTQEHLYSDLTYKIIGAAMNVHSTLGPGHPEEVYQKALEYELQANKIPFESQKAVSILYKGNQVGLRYLDFLVDEKIIVEIKSVNQIELLHEWQVLSYFAATPYEVALLINFGKPKLEYKRMLPSKKILEHRKKNEFTADGAD